MAFPKPFVLIVEDHQFVRESLGNFLEYFDYQVVSASTASEALGLAQMHEFDALLVDVHLPEKDGWELLRDLREQKRLPALVVSMSAYLGNHERERSRVAGCDAHLIKPFRLEELIFPRKRGLDYRCFVEVSFCCS